MKAKVNKTVEIVPLLPGKKRIMINIIAMALIGVITGFCVGMYLVGNQLDPNRYNFDVASLQDNVAEIRTESNSKTPIELGAIKCGALAFDTTFKAERVKIEGKGLVKAKAMGMIVNQTIDALTIRVRDRIYFENISVSRFAKAINRFYAINDDIEHYEGSLSGSTVSWKQSPVNDIKTMDEYQAKFSCTLTDYMTYIVSSKTVVSESAVTIDENGNYSFELELDKSKAVVNYVKNMKATGGLSEYPDFTSNPKIKITMDANYRILVFTSNETYDAKMGITASSVATLTNIFSYDEDFAIPAKTDKSYIKKNTD